MAKNSLQNLTITSKKSNFYNADETCLYWRSLPRKTLASRNESAAAGGKDSKDRETIMFCANASGNSRISLLMIGKSQKPRCFTNVTCLPFIYKAQKSAWMDHPLFMDLYCNHCIPIVESKHEGSRKKRKVILLLNNAPSHPPADALNAVNKNFVVTYLPLSVTAIL